jgi:D-alanyl-D-alanine carboxypeptidase/D-alanyl-D-alanine-endopeptidase (penicillin-binding protein 4)
MGPPPKDPDLPPGLSSNFFHEQLQTGDILDVMAPGGDFYLDTTTNTLWVKGSGDPFLVSEELSIIAKKLAQLGLKNIATIALDVSLFENNLSVPGAGKSNNPYDAIPTAVAANFNTVTVQKKAGKIISAEPQTPLTTMALKITKRTFGHSRIKKNTRINTGSISKDAEQYFAELLFAILEQHGITVGNKVIWGTVPKLAVFYSHINSKNLAEIIRPMMKYSTNFIANQLVLMLSSEHYERTANFSDVKTYMESTLRKHFKWRDFTFKDGAGLSRENRISPTQLVQLLDSFKPWKHLLPEVAPGVYAKSGTLNKVSTLAGYTTQHKKPWQSFALMMNHSVPHRRRNFIAHKLANP